MIGMCLFIELSLISWVSLAVLSLLLNTQFQSYEEPLVGAGVGAGWGGGLEAPLWVESYERSYFKCRKDAVSSFPWDSTMPQGISM